MNFARSWSYQQLTSYRNWPSEFVNVSLATFTVWLVSLLSVLGLSVWGSCPAWGQLIPQPRANQVGLERAWFAQVDLDPSQQRIANWLLHDNLLFAVTTAGTIHALEITTGKTVWSVQVGQPRYPTLGPAANHQNVAVINGSKLILLDRTDGHMKWVRETGAAPASGPALSEDRAFVALINGRIEAFMLNNSKRPPWYYQSVGRAYHKPVTTTKSICWATDLGTLYVGRLKPLNLLFRLETGGEIIASPTEMAPYLLVGSTDGNLYCIHEQSGETLWRYSCGDPIIHAPAVVGDQVFITSHAPALHALDATTGQRQWTTENVTQFVAVGKKHVYGTDRHGNLLVLDAKTGGMVGRLARGRQRSANQLISWNEGAAWSGLNSGNVMGSALINDQNDRILLVSNTGLVQCLHEIGVSDPISYRQSAVESGENADSSANKTSDNGVGSREQDTQAPGEFSQPRDPAEVNKDQDTVTAPNSTPANDNPFGADESNPFD